MPLNASLLISCHAKNQIALDETTLSDISGVNRRWFLGCVSEGTGIALSKNEACNYSSGRTDDHYIDIAAGLMTAPLGLIGSIKAESRCVGEQDHS